MTSECCKWVKNDFFVFFTCSSTFLWGFVEKDPILPVIGKGGVYAPYLKPEEMGVLAWKCPLTCSILTSLFLPTSALTRWRHQKSDKIGNRHCVGTKRQRHVWPLIFWVSRISLQKNTFDWRQTLNLVDVFTRNIEMTSNDVKLRKNVVMTSNLAERFYNSIRHLCANLKWFGQLFTSLLNL